MAERGGRMKVSVIVSKVLLALIIASMPPRAVAQQGETSRPATNTPVQPAPRTPTVPAPPTAPTDSTQQANQELVFISGAVVLEDGTPPPYGAIIQRECGGKVVIETIVDGQGHFGYQVEDPNRLGHIFPDASQDMGTDPIEYSSVAVNPNNQQSVPGANMPLISKLVGCELRAQLSGYHSTFVRFGIVNKIGLINVGTIVLYPAKRVQGTSVSATNLLAPKNSQKNLENARKLLKKGDVDEAEKYINAAIQIYPKYAQAWLELGQLYQQRGFNDEAGDAYKKAVAIDKLFVSPYLSLAWLYAGNKNWQAVAEYTDQLLALDPINLPEGYFLNAKAYYHLDNLDLAQKSAVRGRRMDLENRVPQIYLVLANVLAKKNDAAGYIDAMKQYLKAAPNAPDAPAIRSRIQENEKIIKADSVNSKLQ
jgi:tetratricopeptide (TPR) repeat protein